MNIKPDDCNLIVEGKRTIEVRRNAPHEFTGPYSKGGAEAAKAAFTPFKCYIYCGMGRLVWRRPEPKSAYYFGKGTELSNGKVVGEFVCDEIVPIRIFEDGAIQDWMHHDLERACMPYEEMASYIGHGETGFGWHISGLVIYDHPKELNEFTGSRNIPGGWCYITEGGRNESVKPVHNALQVISWKAKTMGMSYGALSAIMQHGDLEQFAKEFELAMAAEDKRLQAEKDARHAIQAKKKGR